MQNYLISSFSGETSAADVIHDVSTNLKVHAIDLLNSAFTPSKGEVRYFVTAGENKMAFETKGYQKMHRQALILHMISWYCAYSGWVDEAIIHSSRPN